MKAIIVTLQIFLLLLLIGCEPENKKISTGTDKGLKQLCEYAPVKIDVIPLTEFTGDGEEPEIKVYVVLLDEFDCQIKAPAVFRFELHNKVPRSAEPKGKRILIWPDIDLNDPAENNEYWQDFLRSYKFDLPFKPAEDQSYVLQATAMCPNGRRLTTEFTLKNTDQ